MSEDAFEFKDAQKGELAKAGYEKKNNVRNIGSIVLFFQCTTYERGAWSLKSIHVRYTFYS